jgi:tetratricopeptide (TPR) repeat protein
MNRSRILSLCGVSLLIATTSSAGAQSASAPPAPPAADAAFFGAQWARAKSLLDQFLASNPGSLNAHVKAGYVELRLGNAAAAVAHFDEVVSKAPPPGAPAAHAGIAMALAQQGKSSDAIARLTTAVDAGYANYQVLDGDEAFASLRKDPRFVALRGRAVNNAHPCMGDSVARAFDFWVGDWDVYVSGTTQLAGSNRIDRVSGGCAILENWTANTSLLNALSDGKSLNFVVPATRKWRQVWMGSGGGLTYYDEGEYRDGAMRFTYDNATPRGRLTGRFAFFNLGPNKVRQMQESTPDSGRTWQTVYDFIYVRKGSGESPLPPAR